MGAGSDRLHHLLEAAAAASPGRQAVVDPDRAAVSYAELNDLADALAAALSAAGVSEGDRVGICAPKCIGTVASIFGILKAGAAYVPVGADAPMARNAFIFTDCSVRAVVVERSLLDGLRDAFEGGDLPVIDELARFDACGVDLVLVAGTMAGGAADGPRDLAYILYTSGSTGVPKGVMLSHVNALSFIDWCSETFGPTADDRFSSHAPFHFDLSIFDLYLPVKHGACLVLIGEDLGKQPLKLAEVIVEQKISVWYSTPSILRLLVEYGKMKTADFTALRLVFFAGEVFPVKHLRALQAVWPGPAYFNLYGPTETNVCTWYRIPDTVPEDRNDPYPIGKVSCGDRARVVDEGGHDVPRGAEGELVISGPSVMLGYWNLPQRNAEAFIADADGANWYRTGDIVREDDKDGFIYVSRRDRMVKRKGYRVELGEIESAFYRHPSITEAAVVALADEDGVLIKAFLNWTGEDKPSMIKMKQFCMQNLPPYMIPDRFSFLPVLPKTSTDKIDYQTLKEME